MAWAPDYISLAAAKAYLRIADSDDDTLLPIAITTASRAIDDHCNRQFGQVDEAEERRYTARPDRERGLWIIDIDDLTDATGLTVMIGTNAITDYTLEPVNATLKGKAWTRIAVACTSAVQPCGRENEVAGMGLWGWGTQPAGVTQGIQLQLSRFAARRDSPFGIAGSPDQGSELRLLAKVDADVVVALRGLRRRRRVG